MDKVIKKLDEYKVIGVYSLGDAPANAEYIGFKIERNGVLDYSVPGYNVLQPGERKLHLFLIKS